jgi:hypothetical protein
MEGLVTMKKTFLLLIIWVVVGGCQVNPSNGKLEITPLALPAIESGVDTGKALVDDWGELITAVYPPAGLAVGALGALLAGYQKRKNNSISGVSSGLVLALEEYKDSHTNEQWAELEPLIESRIGPKGENIIRAIRGLSPKSLT